jgi:hypothetical protein
MNTRRLPLLACTLACLAPLGTAQAGEIYSQIGVPGLMLGYAQPLNSAFGLRADFATAGHRTAQRTESGIAYDAKLKADRAALLADWYPFFGSFRISAGITSSQYRLDLAATGAGGSLTIGNNTYATTASDRLDAQVRFPSSTPYLGFGWGHQLGSGLRFSMDLGAMVGKATVSYTVSGPLAQKVSQADIDAELTDLRNGVGKVRAIPQLSLGLGYSF